MRTRDKVKCMPPWELIDCIIDAAKNGDCLQLGLYVKRCCELDIIDSLDESGRSALAWAVAEGHLEACKALIDHGADVSQPDEYNQTPLYVASRKGFAKVSELLLASGAVVDAIDIEGETPLGVAASKGHLHVLRVLAAGGADPMIKDDEGLTPLHKARRSGHSGCAEFLSQHIQQQNQAKQRPVHVLDGTARKPPLQFTPDWWSCTLGQLSEAIACHWSIPNPASSLSFGDQTGTFAVQPKLECSATLLALSSAGQVWVWPSRHTPIGRSIPVSTASEFLDSTPSDPQQKRPSSRQAPEPVSTPRSRKKSSLRKKKPAAKKSALSVASTPASKSCPAPSAVGAQSRCSAGPNREPRFDHKTAQPEEKTAADDEDDETAGCNGAVAEDSQSDYMDTVQAIVKQRAKAAKTGSQVSVGNAGSAVSQVQTPVRVQRPSAGVMREADSSPECYSLQAPVSRSTVNCELAFRNQPSLSPACQTPFSPFLSKKTSVKWSTDGKARGIGPLPDGSTLADKKAVASPASVASFCSSLQSSVKHASNSKFSRRRSAPSYGVENSKTVAKASAGSKLSKRSTRSDSAGDSSVSGNRSSSCDTSGSDEHEEPQHFMQTVKALVFKRNTRPGFDSSTECDEDPTEQTDVLNEQSTDDEKQAHDNKETATSRISARLPSLSQRTATTSAVRSDDTSEANHSVTATMISTSKQSGTSSLPTRTRASTPLSKGHIHQSHSTGRLSRVLDTSLRNSPLKAGCLDYSDAESSEGLRISPGRDQHEQPSATQVLELDKGEKALSPPLTKSPGKMAEFLGVSQLQLPPGECNGGGAPPTEFGSSGTGLNASVNSLVPGEHRFTGLHQAAAAGEVCVAEYLLATATIQNNNYVNCIDPYGRTPLIWACAGGHISVVKLLLSHDAAPHVRDKDGRTAIFHAAVNGHNDLLQYFSAEVEETSFHDLDNEGHSMVQWVAYKGYLSTMRYLLEVQNVRHDLPDDNDRLAMHWAARQGKADIIRYLVQKGSAVYLKDKNGMTPEDHAIEKKQWHAVSVLRDAKLHMHEANHTSLDWHTSVSNALSTSTGLMISNPRPRKTMTTTVLGSSAGGASTPVSLASSQRRI